MSDGYEKMSTRTEKKLTPLYLPWHTKKAVGTKGWFGVRHQMLQGQCDICHLVSVNI